MDFGHIASVLVLILFVEIRANHFTGISGCRTTKLDLIFVVDASTPMYRDNFHLVRNWIQNISSHFDVSPYSTRVAVVQNGETPYTEFGLNVFESTEDVVHAVANVQFGTGSSTTGDTLRHVKDHVLSSAREQASKVVLYLSDGEIRKHNDVSRAAKVLHDMEVTTFAIGAGENMADMQNIAHLKLIASDPMQDHLFFVQELENIGSIEQKLISELCKHTVQECPTASHDLAFIIDGSSTIGYRDFRKIREWMKKIVNAFDVGTDETRIAVIQYSTHVQEEIRFDDNLTKSEVLEVIDGMRLMSGDTSTGYALEYIMKVIFAGNNGARNNIPDVAIVMTDGKAQDHPHVIAAAKSLHDAGIEVYAVGVADYSLDEVRDIASDPDENHVILATSFDQIDLQRIGLIKRICEESEPGCPSTAADIVFMVDNVVTEDPGTLENTKAWIKSIVDTLEVGPHYSRIALASYNSDTELLFGLSAYDTTSQVLSAISRKLRQKTGYSMTGKAIDYARNFIFSGARKGVPKFLLVLTDGKSDDDVRKAVQESIRSGIEIFSFGVGDVDLPTLHSIASQPDMIFFDRTFDGIRRKHGQFMATLCRISEPACSEQEIDLQFLVDGSSTIQTSNFDKVKIWIKNVIRSFDIGNYTTRVGITQYSSEIQNEFDMNTYKNKREIEHAVEKMKFMGGIGHTGIALDYAMEHSFTEDAGSREGAEKVLVILTDGNSRDSIDEATKKVHKAGIRVFAVGAGSNTDREYLEKMATEPIVSHVTESASYDGINTVRQQLVGEICRETKSECAEAEMDLIFLVDGSSSIGQQSFELAKDWLISFVNQFEIGEYNSKIGVIQYSNEPRMEINMKKLSDKQALTAGIEKMKYLTGQGFTGSALRYVRSQGFSDERGARNKAPKVVIVLTDGDSRDSVATPAQLLHDQGVFIYAVGVGDTDQSELRSIASSDENVLHVRNYDAITTIQSSLTRRVCDKVQIDCRENATDIVMVIDGSNSVGYRDWEVMKSFMRNITERFHIGVEGVQVGVVQYATNPETEFMMSGFGDISALHKAIDKIEWMMGDTHTAQALRFVRSKALTSSAGARGSNVSKILIVVTDGDPQDSDEVAEAAAAIHMDGWRVFAIGVGQATIPELNVIASDPDQDHVFYADNYESTRKLKGRLFRMICTEYEIETEKKIPDSRQHFDFPAGERFTLELKEPEVVDIDTKNISRYIIANFDPDFDINVHGSNQRDNPEGPDDLIILPKSPRPVNSIAQSCPKVNRVEKTSTRGWDILRELDIRRHPDNLGKPKRSTILNRFIGNVERFRAIRTKPGSNEDRTSFRLLSSLGLSAPLNPVVAKIFKDTFTFVTTMRMQGSTNEKNWTLVNITDEDDATIFSLSFQGEMRVLVLGMPSRGGVHYHEINSSEIGSLFDKDFHKLEIKIGSRKVSIKIDCQSLSGITPTFLPSRRVSRRLHVALMTTSTSGIINDAIVDMQEMIFKCETSAEENCCELPGKPCVPNTPIVEITAKSSPKSRPETISNSSQESNPKSSPDSDPKSSPETLNGNCVCPPGPTGPPGPQGPPGTIKRGPRGPPGKSACPPVSKTTVRNMAKKISNTLIQAEFRNMYQVLLNSITDDGRINSSLIQNMLKGYGEKSDSGKAHASTRRKSKPGHRRKPRATVDPEILSFDGEIPADILDKTPK